MLLAWFTVWVSDVVVIVFRPEMHRQISILVQFKFYSFIGETKTKQNKTNK
jgi:hypothetical protein